MTNGRLVRLVALATVATAGCDSVTSEKIQTWKGTVKGPGKLEDAWKAPAVEPRLRAEAAVALYELGKADVVELGLPTVAPAERSVLVAAMFGTFAAGLKDPKVERVRDARDGLYAIRPYATAGEQASIDRALLPVIEADLRAGRTAGGRHSLDKILMAIGSGAGPMLLGLLSDAKVPFQGVVELLGKVADHETREKAGVALVKRAGDAPVSPQMWQALGAMGGKTVVEFLRRRVEAGGETDATQAAQALQHVARDPALVPWALRLAGDAKVNKGVRDEMFGLCEYLGGPQARDGLLRIIASDPDEMVRYRAFEAALATGKSPTILAALEAFSPNLSFKREDVVDLLVKDVQKVGPMARPALVKVLASQAPLARLVAVLALEQLGGSAEAAAVEKLATDAGKVKGIADPIGKEAARVAAVLKNKVK
jgi:HEAT repeat protein